MQYSRIFIDAVVQSVTKPNTRCTENSITFDRWSQYQRPYTRLSVRRTVSSKHNTRTISIARVFGHTTYRYILYIIYIDTSVKITYIHIILTINVYTNNLYVILIEGNEFKIKNITTVVENGKIKVSWKLGYIYERYNTMVQPVVNGPITYYLRYKVIHLIFLTINFLK
jgi:hypothetical protein